MTQPGVGLADCGQEFRCPVTVLNIGGMDDGGDQQPIGIGQKMAFAPLDALASIVAARAASLRRLDRLAVDHSGGGTGLAPHRLARGHHQGVVDAVPDPIVAPAVEEPLYGRHRRKILGQQAPVATCCRNVEDAVQNLAQIRRSRPAQPLRRWEERFQRFPLHIGHVVGIPQPFAQILRAGDFIPHHLVFRRSSLQQSEWRIIEITQLFWSACRLICRR